MWPPLRMDGVSLLKNYHSEESAEEKGGEQRGETNNTHAVSDIVQKQWIRYGKLQRIYDQTPRDTEKGKAHQETKGGLFSEEDRYIVKEDDEADHGARTAHHCLQGSAGMRGYDRGEQQQDHEQSRGEHVPALQSTPVAL